MKTKQEQKEEALKIFYKIVKLKGKIYDVEWNIYLKKCAEIDKQVDKQVGKVITVKGKKYQLIEE